MIREGATSKARVKREYRFDEAKAIFLRWHRVEGHSELTIRNYADQLRIFRQAVAPGRPSYLLSESEPLSVILSLEELKARGCSPYTIRTHFRHVFAFFKWCVRWGLLEKDADPCKDLTPPRVPKLRKPFLTRPQFDALIGVCNPATLTGRRDLALLWMLLSTGMRRAELVALTLEDLDWERSLVRIRWGKGQKERWVPLMREAQRAVLYYLALRKDVECPELWLSYRRDPLTYRGLGRAMVEIYRKAGVKTNDPAHIFRRTWAANSVRQNIPRQYTQIVGGWESPEMIDKYVAAMGLEEEEARDAYRGFNPLPQGG